MPLALLVSTLILGQTLSPSATVEKFVAAVNQRDLRTMATLTKGADPDSEFLKAMGSKVLDSFPTLTVSQLSERIQGNSATVLYNLKIRQKGRPDEDHRSATQVELIKKRWMIVPADPKRLADIKDYVSAIAVLVANPQEMGMARDAAIATAALSNVKQICLAVHMFAADNDDRLVFANASMQSKLMPYLKEPKVFIEPLSKRTNAFVFNDRLSGLSLARIGSPAETVLISLGAEGKLEFPYAGRTVVGFADGHVRLVPQADASKLRWSP